jgi:hypothetical protein
MIKQLLLLLIVALGLQSCAGNPPTLSNEAAALAFVFEYQDIENDSISLLAGNTLRLHTGKALPDQFYPILITIRAEGNLETPLSTDYIGSDSALVAMLMKQNPNAKDFGVILRESALKQVQFNEADAVRPIRKAIALIPGARLRVYRESDGVLLR